MMRSLRTSVFVDIRKHYRIRERKPTTPAERIPALVEFSVRISIRREWLLAAL
jgi:hypothetical protein